MSRKQARYGQPAVYNVTPPALVDGDDSALSVDDKVRLKVTTAPLSALIDEVSTVTRPVATSTGSNIASSATSVTLFVANANRRGASIFNDSTQTLYIKKGATASLTSFWLTIAPKGYFQFPLPIYQGIVDGIWDSANGAARITEDI